MKKRVWRHLRKKQNIYYSVIAVLICIVAIMMAGQMMVEKENEHEVVVKSLSGTPEEQYQAALTTLNGGNFDYGRVMMLRMARLGDTTENPLGFGKAHLWVAKDMLGNFESDYIWDFPRQSGMQGQDTLALGDQLPIVQLHLHHAADLSPELESPALILAATYADQGQRNKALDVLLEAVAHDRQPQPRLHIPLANILSMRGDNLALQEKAWHLFSTLGHDISKGSGRDVSRRVKYVLSMLFLNKFENAEVAIRRLESHYPKPIVGSKDTRDYYAEVRALRMAYHYHKAIHHFLGQAGKEEPDLEEAIDHLAVVMQIQPDCKSAIDALSFIAARDLTQKERVQKILKDVLSRGSSKKAHARATLLLALAEIEDPSADGKRKEYVHSAVAVDPNNTTVILKLMELLASGEKPDYSRILDLSTKALAVCGENERAECYYMIGLAQLRMRNWNEAIIALEKSLKGDGDKAKLHDLLAQAYQAVGKVTIAALHKKQVLKHR